MTRGAIRPETPERDRCESPTKRGERCRMAALPGRKYCLSHDPDPATRARVRDGQITGGRNSARLARAVAKLPPDLRHVYDRLAQALDDLQAGTLEPGRATAMAAVARAIVAVLDAAASLERIADLEDLLKAKA